MSAFYRRVGVPDGRMYACKECVEVARGEPIAPRVSKAAKQAGQQRRYKRWLAAHPEDRQRQRREARTRERERDPVGYQLKRREVEARRRARRRGAYVERVDPEAVWERDSGVCGICGEPADVADWHLDHVIPLAAGGEHSHANVQVSHPACNRSKGAKVAA